MSAYSGTHWSFSSASMFASSNLQSDRNAYFTNDVEMEEISDEEPMDFEIISSEEHQDPATVARQVEQDEILARTLQAQYYAEARISVRHRPNARVQFSFRTSRQGAGQLQNSRLQQLQEDLWTISLLLRTWTPFLVQDQYEDALEILFELEQRSKGLKESQINALPTRKFSSSEFAGSKFDESSFKDCSICLSEYVNGEMLRILPCYHKFHVACIDKWLKSRNTCPMCRNEIPRQ